ncbi:hypothetical protein, partial [Streptomyces zhihengii]
MTRGFKKINENATIPERATEHSAGYDISASETVTIQPDEIKMVTLLSEPAPQAAAVRASPDASSTAVTPRTARRA